MRRWAEFIHLASGFLSFLLYQSHGIIWPQLPFVLKYDACLTLLFMSFVYLERWFGCLICRESKECSPFFRISLNNWVIFLSALEITVIALNSLWPISFFNSIVFFSRSCFCLWNECVPIRIRIEIIPIQMMVLILATASHTSCQWINYFLNSWWWWWSLLFERISMLCFSIDFLHLWAFFEVTTFFQFYKIING